MVKNLIGHNISWTLHLVVHCSDNNVDANGNANGENGHEASVHLFVAFANVQCIIN